MSTVDGVAGTTQTKDQLAQTRLTTDTQSFLRLLTAQLKNQDPMQPVDSTQWVSQLAQFSSVEQAVAANSKIAEVLSELKSSNDRMDLSYIGRQVEVDSGTVGLKDGKLSASYSIPEGAKSVDLYILDGDGRIVASAKGDPLAGTHSFTWDGTTSTGTKAPDGAYTVLVQATDENSKSLTAGLTHSAKVTGIRREDGSTVFVLDDGTTTSRDAIIAAA